MLMLKVLAIEIIQTLKSINLNLGDISQNKSNFYFIDRKILYWNARLNPKEPRMASHHVRFIYSIPYPITHSTTHHTPVVLSCPR